MFYRIKGNICNCILLFSALLIVANHHASAQSVKKPEQVQLWPDGPPGSGGPGGTENITPTGSHTRIANPYLIVHQPLHPNGMAVLVISGGGYAHVEVGKESTPAANWLQANGITAFELVYRLPAESWSSADVAFEDGQRAIRLIRSWAVKYQVDTSRVGVMGFSAGGHLAGMLETMPQNQFYKPVDKVDLLSAKPNFAVLLYPVITMMPPYDNTHSGKSIMGKFPRRSKQEEYSVELHVTPNTPPTFLAQAADDPIANVANSQLMYSALQKNHVPSEIHIFPTGGHGWGMGDPGTPVHQWPELFKKWAMMNKFWN